MKLEEKYKKEVIPIMMTKFGLKNVMAVPKVEKVIINSGFGRIVAEKTSDEQKKVCEAILNDLSLIAGQRPNLTKAKKSISSFKIREGQSIGVRLTLRGRKMFDFLERLINIGLPRSRDFRGIEQKSFDGKGNLTIGIREHICFPEISPEKVKTIFGFEVTIVTNAKKREEVIELFKLLGFPIKS